MAEAPVEFIVAAFQDEHGAENALKELKQAKREKLIRIEAAAIVRRDQKDKLHVKEMREEQRRQVEELRREAQEERREAMEEMRREAEDRAREAEEEAREAAEEDGYHMEI